MQHSTGKDQDLQTGVDEHNWCLTLWDRMPSRDAKGKHCLDVWIFDELLWRVIPVDAVVERQPQLRGFVSF
jgi:hypothetical protein